MRRSAFLSDRRAAVSCVNHNPIRFLVSLPSQRIAQLAHDRASVRTGEVWARFQSTCSTTASSRPAPCAVFGPSDIIAYFPMEFGLHECIPSKRRPRRSIRRLSESVFRLNLPVVGIGLVYKYGYFTQRINMKGEQEEQFVEFDNHLVPMHEVRAPTAEGLRRSPGSSANPPRSNSGKSTWARPAPAARHGHSGEPPHLRDITHELYVSDRAARLQQELVLGIGGVRALEALHITRKSIISTRDMPPFSSSPGCRS